MIGFLIKRSLGELESIRKVFYDTPSFVRVEEISVNTMTRTTQIGNGLSKQGIWTIKIKFKRSGNRNRHVIKKGPYLKMIGDSRNDKKSTRIKDGYPFWYDCIWVNSKGRKFRDYVSGDYDWTWWR
jgi:hypothetical protein